MPTLTPRIPFFIGTLLTTLLFIEAVYAQNGAAPVKVEKTAQSEIFHQLPLVGSVSSPQVSLISTQTNGLVKTLHVDVGDTVSKGDLLLELDPELAGLQLDSAKANVEQAEQAYIDAQRRLKEAQPLVAERSIAQSAVMDLEAEVQMDKAQLHQVQAEAAYQAALLARHQLKAPFSGVVSRKLVEQGEWVNTGNGLFELVATRGLYINFFVAEDYLAKINRNTEVRFSLNAYPDLSFSGSIDRIVPVSDAKARTFLLRVNIPETGEISDVKIIPGMSANATLLAPTGRTGLTVSRDAILRNQNGSTIVWSIENNEGSTTVKENRVQTGLAFNGYIEVLSGLNAGAQVVIAGNEALRNGQRVIVTQ